MFVVAIAIAIGGGVTLLCSQGVRHDKFSVDNGRPLLLVLKSLEERYGWAVTYEDPPREYSGDVRDQTESGFREQHHGQRRLYPKGGHFEFFFDVVGNERPAQKEGLEELMRAYLVWGFSDEFCVSHSMHRSHIEPCRIRNADGKWVARRSILNERISFPKARRSTRANVQTLLDQVAVANHVNIGIGTIPIHMFDQVQGEQGAQNEVARDVLLRILEDMNRDAVEHINQLNTIVWYLAYDPGSQMYFFSAHTAAMEVEGPTGTKIWQPI